MLKLINFNYLTNIIWKYFKNCIMYKLNIFYDNSFTITIILLLILYYVVNNL